MAEISARTAPPDHAQRERALDPACSVLVQAPAGSGKTTLLAERFLRLLAEVDEPGQVVAITFTNAAAAEMRNRILDALGSDAPSPLAQRVLNRSQTLNWNLLDLPAQLRISTIDSFCRDLALQQPLLSRLGDSLEIAEQPTELYRRAAQKALEKIGSDPDALRTAAETLLLWRDNNWQEMENLLVEMLKERDRWMHNFLLAGEQDWEGLRVRLEAALARIAPNDIAEARYTDEEWTVVRACFELLRLAAAELQVAFAEAGTVDFTEVSQLALHVLTGPDGQPSDAALSVADGIRHLLVDEFQDTSRRQHQLLARLIAAWPQRENRTCFVVGDPMQSIYFFRDADAELFPRVGQLGLEIPNDDSLLFEMAQLAANFRTAPQLVDQLNGTFATIFAIDDGSGVAFTQALAARDGDGLPHLIPGSDRDRRMELHIDFVPQAIRGSSNPDYKARIGAERAAAQKKQIDEIVALVRGHMGRINAARAAKQKYRIAVLGRTRNVLAPVALALRDAGIPFRALELETLKQRPEIIDALALARALLNPEDRAAWLGVLRAPWCGLSLVDLHTVASADDAELLMQPVRELLARRVELLSEEGQAAGRRVIRALQFAERLRQTQPALSIGTWLEQVWLRLGGAACIEAAARANLDLLWDSLDALPDGEPGLLGSALDAALEKLNAQPDPDVDSECGVQLMTIHKSKGLEFEVVLIPELHAGSRRGKFTLLSWLERGRAPELDDGAEQELEITEFLVAPLQSKGADRGEAKKWVDGVRREREKQEMRRLFYVAATRAREELHIFARPEFKAEKNGSLELVAPKDSLLATAWPAFETEIRERFTAWKTPVSEELVELAAAQTDDAIAPPNANKSTLIRRLPTDFAVAAREDFAPPAEYPLVGTGDLYQRHEGGLISRALGNAVHDLLQHLAQILTENPTEAALASLPEMRAWVTRQVRAVGLDAQQANRIAEQAIAIARDAANHPIGQWILSPHAEAASEARWAGIVDGVVRTVQIDRVFCAGPLPQSAAESAADSTWWIVDYKTASADEVDPAVALPDLRRIFAPQLETYARVLRNLKGANASICAGLYYPRMSLFDWWRL